MSTEVENVAEEPTPKESVSRQDQFFGIETVIGKEEVTPPKEPVGDEAITFKNAEELDEEMKKYAQKRIDTLTYDRHEAQRQQQAAEKLRDEAVHFAQSQGQKIQHYEHIINTGEGELIKQWKNAATLAAEQAAEKHRKAYEESDTEAVTSALEDMFHTQSALKVARDSEANYAQRAQQFAARPPPQQQLPPVQPQPTEKTLAWARENPWFQSKEHQDMTAFVHGVDQMIKGKGFVPDTKEYFTELDREMRVRFPEHFTQPPSTPVAAATRTSNTRSRRTKLSDSEKRIARKAGLTDEQYDLEKRKIEQSAG